MAEHLGSWYSGHREWEMLLTDQEAGQTFLYYVVFCLMVIARDPLEIQGHNLEVEECLPHFCGGCLRAQSVISTQIRPRLPYAMRAGEKLNEVDENAGGGPGWRGLEIDLAENGQQLEALMRAPSRGRGIQSLDRTESQNQEQILAQDAEVE